MKKFVIFLSVFALMFAAIPVMAAEETGSISVTLKADNKVVNVSDGTFDLYKVADVIEDDNNDMAYQYTTEFKNCGYQIDFDNENLSADLLAWANSREVEPVVTDTPENGSLIFSDLSLGLYLVAQGISSDGYYAAIPFLVSVPLYQDGAYVYNVDASPKMESLEKKSTISPSPEPTPEPDQPKGDNGNNGNNGNDQPKVTNTQTPKVTTTSNTGDNGKTSDTSSQTKSGSNAKTSDTFALIGWSCILAAAILTFIAVLIRRRRMA